MSDLDDVIPTGRRAVTRQKILEAAYTLFTAQGVNLVGVDTISARSGVAKMTLYHHFHAKENLVLAYLDLRAKRWTVGWLKAGVKTRGATPRARLLAIFDLLHEWFEDEGFEGCPFLRIICESDVGSPVHKATALKLGQIENFLGQLARSDNLPDPNGLASVWMMLMDGAIMSARAGRKDAALKAKQAAAVLLDAWGRKPAKSGSPAPVKRRAKAAPKRKPSR
ncbi:MAG: TetR/AcrR family transcriptional regulator [Proteobacteria bacterium]|nr:TetR/AcrR family transcriptional regulator [Pseudomonadota bacterium]